VLPLPPSQREDYRHWGRATEINATAARDRQIMHMFHGSVETFYKAFDQQCGVAMSKAVQHTWRAYNTMKSMASKLTSALKRCVELKQARDAQERVLHAVTHENADLREEVRDLKRTLKLSRRLRACGLNCSAPARPARTPPSGTLSCNPKSPSCGARCAIAAPWHNARRARPAGARWGRCARLRAGASEPRKMS